MGVHPLRVPLDIEKLLCDLQVESLVPPSVLRPPSPSSFFLLPSSILSQALKGPSPSPATRAFKPSSFSRVSSPQIPKNKPFQRRKGSTDVQALSLSPDAVSSSSRLESSFVDSGEVFGGGAKDEELATAKLGGNKKAGTEGKRAQREEGKMLSS